jgi:hypothetical protein
MAQLILIKGNLLTAAIKDFILGSNEYLIRSQELIDSFFFFNHGARVMR